MEHQNQNLRNGGGNDHRPHWGAGKTELTHVKRGAQLRVQLSKRWLQGLASPQLIFQLPKPCTQPYKAAFYMLLYLT